ncbi:MAG: hypothetical protein ACTSP9_03140 [Promethearchaeota archaeon]
MEIIQDIEEYIKNQQKSEREASQLVAKYFTRYEKVIELDLVYDYYEINELLKEMKVIEIMVFQLGFYICQFSEGY